MGGHAREKGGPSHNRYNLVRKAGRVTGITMGAMPGGSVMNTEYPQFPDRSMTFVIAGDDFSQRAVTDKSHLYIENGVTFIIVSPP